MSDQKIEIADLRKKLLERVASSEVEIQGQAPA
jgi:hypothetical protein